MGRSASAGVSFDPVLLRERRLLLSHTQQSLAACAGIAERTLRWAETGTPISVDSAVRVGRALQLPLVSLVSQSPAHVRLNLLERGCAPPRAPRHFVGRRRELDAAVSSLTSGRSRAPFCIVGEAGSGKTALAAAIAARVSEAFSGVAWVSATQARLPHIFHSPDGHLLNLAEALGFEGCLPAPARSDAPAWQEGFRRLLWRHKLLLVLDDVTDAALVSALRDPAGEGHVLVTTTHRRVADAWPETRARLAGLSDGEATELLSHRLGSGRVAAAGDGLARLLRVLAGHPRDLDQAASYLGKHVYLGLGEHADELAANRFAA